MIGQGFGFQNKTGGCQVFAVMGPYHDTVSVTSGEWWVYKNGDVTPAWEQTLIQELIDKQRQLYGCATSTVTTIG